MITLKQAVQETEYNCGPAVLQTLLGYFGKAVSQDEVIEAAQLSDWIATHGTQPHHMSLAMEKVAPEFNLYIKNKATVEDLNTLINEKRLPVAVNWQGLFYDTAAEEPMYPSLDNGHYSIVVDIDLDSDTIHLTDPYPTFANKVRTFPLSWFKERWWDIATEKNPQTNKDTKLLTNQLLFVVTRMNEPVLDHLEEKSVVTSS